MPSEDFEKIYTDLMDSLLKDDADSIRYALMCIEKITNKQDYLEQLIKKINESDGFSNPLHLLAHSGSEAHIPLLDAIIKSGIKVDTVNKDGSTALMIGAFEGNIAMVTFLLEQKANPNLRQAKSKGNKSALELATLKVFSLQKDKAPKEKIEKLNEIKAILVDEYGVKPISSSDEHYLYSIVNQSGMPLYEAKKQHASFQPLKETTTPFDRISRSLKNPFKT